MLLLFYLIRVSTTVVRAGLVGGATGPTVILCKGARVKEGHTNEFLLLHGLPPGSTLVTTKNAYMTDKA